MLGRGPHGNDEVQSQFRVRVQIGVQVQPSMVGVSKLEQRASYLHANPQPPAPANQLPMEPNQSPLSFA